MHREALDSLDKQTLTRLVLAQAETVTALRVECEALRARVAELEAKLGLPPKTPDNSSTPPSRGQKTSEEESRKPKGRAHAGAHRPLHPNPTRSFEVLARRCEHCAADLSAVAQVALQAYDRIEIPEIRPDVTRVTLHGGVCPCCAKKFKAAPPAGLEPGSPFGPNLRAFAIYLRSPTPSRSSGWRG
jgi:transposase